MKIISRRAVTAGMVGTAALAIADRLQPARKQWATPPQNTPGLRWHAKRRGMSFGTMVTADQIAPGSPLRKTIVTEADMIVPGIEMKWGETEKKRCHPDYARADLIVDFAKAHGMAVRGHAGFWYRNIPRWARPLMTGPGAAALIVDRVSNAVSHFKGRIAEWDVVNEAIEPNDHLPGNMRAAPFRRATDPGWIADCFHAAHAADPAAKLMYNDYALENDVPADAARRRATLALLEELKRRNAPVHMLGLQTHIGVDQKFNAAVYAQFLADAAAMNLSLRITEMDINDRRAPTDIAARDRAVADRASALLDVAFAQPAMLGVITWGLDDAHSQFGSQPAMARSDGMPQRALPLDASLQRKPLWAAIASAYDRAPKR